MQFETKIAVVLRDDLAGCQETNVTTFLVSGNRGNRARRCRGAVRRRAGKRARASPQRHAGHLHAGVFATGHDEANRAAVRRVAAEELDLVGNALRAERKTVDKIVDRLRFHP